jgi:hypothetical protein
MHVGGRSNARAYWNGSAHRAATGGTTPRIGSVLLAVLVVALLTMGLHVLFQ